MTVASLLAAGALLNGAASAIAFRRGSLDAGGAVAAVAVGTLIFGLGGPLFWVVLVVFFVTSTAAGMVRRREKEWMRSIHQKGERRDVIQVLANGGLGALAALVWRLTGWPGWAAAFAVSIAASNADTWASEIGVLSRKAPVSLISFRPMPRGISGGVTPLGTAAGLAGALLIGLVFALLNLALRAVPGPFAGVALFVSAGGFAGSLVDSLLGATVQARYASSELPGAAMLTERRTGPSGASNALVHGLPFVNNDVVNALSGLAAVALALLAAPLLT